MERIATAVNELGKTLGRERKLPSATAKTAAVGKREAARQLGVDRTTTLEDIIRAGAIKNVKIGGRIRIPRSESERIAEEGTTTVASAKRQRRSRVSKTESEAIEAIDLDDL